MKASCLARISGFGFGLGGGRRPRASKRITLYGLGLIRGLGFRGLEFRVEGLEPEALVDCTSPAAKHPLPHRNTVFNERDFPQEARRLYEGTVGP